MSPPLPNHPPTKGNRSSDPPPPTKSSRCSDPAVAPRCSHIYSFPPLVAAHIAFFLNYCNHPIGQAASAVSYPPHMCVGPTSLLVFKILLSFFLTVSSQFFARLWHTKSFIIWFYGPSLVAQMVKNLPVNAGDAGSISRLGRSPREGDLPFYWPPIPVFLPGESHGQKSLVGNSPWGHKVSDMTERLSTHTLLLACCIRRMA